MRKSRADRYRAAVTSLMEARTRPDHSDADEASRVSDLDTLWWSLSSSEQDRLSVWIEKNSLP